MKKFFLFFLVIFSLVSGNLMAQDYSTAVGAKFYAGWGATGGLNVRHNLAANSAVEGSLLFGSGLVALEGLYEFQGPINNAPGLNYFAGGGALLGFGTGNGNGSTGFGIRLTGGLDYKFQDVPIDVSLGLDPLFMLAPHTGSDLGLGIGFRFVLP